MKIESPFHLFRMNHSQECFHMIVYFKRRDGVARQILACRDLYLSEDTHYYYSPDINWTTAHYNTHLKSPNCILMFVRDKGGKRRCVRCNAECGEMDITGGPFTVGCECKLEIKGG